MVFGSVGFGLIIVGVGMGIRVVEAWNATKEFAIGTSLVMILLMVIGILSVFNGVMLDAISKILLKMNR